MAKVQWNPAAILAPLPPTLVTCGTMDKPNVLTVAWAGIVSTRPPKTYISVRPERHSYNMIKDSGEFVINLPTAEIVKAVDFCGVRTGAKTDKFAATGLQIEPSTLLAAPMIVQCPINIECRVCGITEQGSHHMFLADIVKVNVDDRFLEGGDGALQIDKCNLLAYAHGSYFPLGKPLGTFGFSVRKKPRQVRKQQAIKKRGRR